MIRRDELIAHDPRNAEVIQPYVIGKDLNQRPDCSASRWVINFRTGRWSKPRNTLTASISSVAL